MLIVDCIYEFKFVIVLMIEVESCYFFVIFGDLSVHRWEMWFDNPNGTFDGFNW